MSELLIDFQQKCPDLIQDLMNSNHHWSITEPSPHHLEGSTYTHVLMVMLMAETRKVSDIVKIAALMHDLGKPMAEQRVEDKKRTRFIGHEGLSLFVGHRYLATLGLSEEEMVHVWKLVSNHTYLYQRMKLPSFEQDVADRFRGNVQLLEDLISLAACDALGRFSLDSEGEHRVFWENAEENLAHLVYKTQDDTFPRTNTKGEVIVLVGPPLSGKSTWLKSNAQGYEVVSRDNVIMELGKGKQYTESFYSVDQTDVDKLYDLKRKEAINAKKSVVFDLTHMTEKSRRKSLDGISRDFKRTAVVFISSYKTLLARNERRAKEEGKHIPVGVLKNMMSSFSFPLISEGFDEIKYVFSKEE